MKNPTQRLFSRICCRKLFYAVAPLPIFIGQPAVGQVCENDSIFPSPTPIPVPAPSTPTTGDINNDGFVDLIISSATDHSIHVFTNDGKNQFENPEIYPLSSRGFMLACEDLNGDGWQDMALVTSSTLQVMLNLGDGTFIAGPATALDNASDIAMRDYNDDGDLDVITADPTNEAISVWLGRGDGTFEDSTSYHIGFRASEIEAADLNCDGWPDFAALLDSNQISILYIILSDGNGDYLPKMVYNTDAGPANLKTSDLNGDGSPDIVTANRVGGTVSVFLNNGDGTLSTRSDYEAGESTTSLFLDDIDGDNHIDIVALSGGSADYRVFHNDGEGYFSKSTGYGALNFSGGMIGSDINRDGSPDILLAYGNPRNFCTIIYNDGFGTFSSPILYNTPRDSSFVQTADVNGDSLDDIIVVNRGFHDPTAGSMTIYFNNGDSTLTEGPSYTIPHYGARPASLAVGDLDTDGDIDVILGWSTSSSHVSVFLNDGDGGFELKRNIGLPTTPDLLKLADMNSDGRLDMVYTGLANRIYIYFGSGGGDFIYNTWWEIDGFVGSFCIVDINHDDDLDFIVGNRAKNMFTVFRNYKNGHFLPLDDIALEGPPAFMATEDFNQDGHIDIAVVDQNGEALTIALNDGMINSYTLQSFPTAANPAAMVVEDFNFDGAKDLVVMSEDRVPALIHTNSGDGFFDPPASLLISPEAQSMASADISQYGRDLVVVTGRDTLVVHKNDCYGNCTLAGDFNKNGRIDFFDLSSFFFAFNNDDLAADFDQDGRITFFDLSAFLIAFKTGCP